jgi:hypothetical protein
VSEFRNWEFGTEAITVDDKGQDKIWLWWSMLLDVKK